MIPALQSRTAQDFTQAASQTPWQWAAESVDYSRASNYETPFKGPFDADLMPFWRQPLEDMCSIDIREVVVAKCSRGGGSENFLLTRLRYAIARQPEPTLYMTDSLENAETFMEDRIKRGMALSADTLGQYEGARTTEHMIRFTAMDLRVWWAKAKGAYKQTGYGLILADEVSMWPVFGADQIRKRADYYPFHHIGFISSPDPTKKGNPEHDPILVLYRDTNRCIWMMPDPGRQKRRFHFTFGGKDKKAGLLWPKEAKRGDEWDLDLVRKKTIFITQAGTKVTNDMREDLMRAGTWVATSESKRADVTGYKVVAPMIPTQAGDFGELAARFLAAKHHLQPDGTKEDMHRNPIRVYFAEYWAEAHREEQTFVHDDTLADRRAEYKRETVYCPKDYKHGIFLTADPQKYHIWWLARVWSINEKTGEVQSGLLDWGTVAGFVDLDKKAAEFSPSMTGIDLNYRLRATEVADFCASYTPQGDPRSTRVFALVGSDSLTAAPTEWHNRDALEGKRKASGPAMYVDVTWGTDYFRSWLTDLMNSRRGFWWIPKDIAETPEGLDYLKQVTSTKKVDGIWVEPKHRQDHLWDCECMQLVLARFNNLIR